MPKVAVIGGGAAGLMAAGRAKELGADVTVFENYARAEKADTADDTCGNTGRVSPLGSCKEAVTDQLAAGIVKRKVGKAVF